MALKIRHIQIMAEDGEMDIDEEKPRKRRGCLSRLFIWGFFLLIAIVGLSWFFLPQIAERVMRNLLADADLERADFKIREITWNSATFEKISFADENWSLSAKEMRVDYAPLNLLDGRMGKITLAGGVCELVLPKKEDKEDGKALEIPWIGELTGMVKQVGSFQAADLALTLKRDGKKFSLPLDVIVKAEDAKSFGALLQSPDFVMNLRMTTKKSITAVATDFTEVKPARFLELVELAIDYDGHLLPEGVNIATADLAGVLRFKNDQAEPLSLRGTLQDVRYDGGDTPIELAANSVKMNLSQTFGGQGSVEFSGGLRQFNVPLDLELGTAFSMQKGAAPKWWATIGWGGVNGGISAKLDDFSLTGTFQKIPFSLKELRAEMSKSGKVVNATAQLTHQEASVPITYQHKMQIDENGTWSLAGGLDFESLDLTKIAPTLGHLDSLSGITLGGEIAGHLDFQVGAKKELSGKLVAKIRNASVATDDLISLAGIDGAATFELLPEASSYTFDLSGKNLQVSTKKALDFDLSHDSKSSFILSGKGNLGDSPKLEASIKNLNLHGANGKKSLALNETSIMLTQVGDILNASGFTKHQDNLIPFNYRHEKKSSTDGWELAGFFQIKAADLKNPIDDANIPIKAMEGKALTGRVAAKMDFSVGNKKDFDGVLSAQIQDGILLFEDDGPNIQGIKGSIRLSSLKKIQSDEFHRFFAEKMTIGDIKTKNLRLDVKLLPNGGISLRSTVLSALGGTIWADPFVIPDDDEDYKMTIHMKQIGLPELIALFPDFNGRVTGSVDGILPVSYVKGEFVPQRGGLTLSPGKNAALSYDAGDTFSAGLDPKEQKYQQMILLEKSLKALNLGKLDIRLFDPKDKDKAIVIRVEGQAKSVKGSPPIILNINGFKPDDDSANFFDLLLRHRDKLNFGL